MTNEWLNELRRQISAARSARPMDMDVVTDETMIQVHGRPGHVIDSTVCASCAQPWPCSTLRSVAARYGIQSS